MAERRVKRYVTAAFIPVTEMARKPPTCEASVKIQIFDVAVELHVFAEDFKCK